MASIVWILLRLFFVAFMAYVLYKLLWKAPNPSPSSGRSNLLEPMERDPVCGAFVPRSQTIDLKRNKETHYFCSQKCLQEFEQNPDRYLKQTDPHTPDKGSRS